MTARRQGRSEKNDRREETEVGQANGLRLESWLNQESVHDLKEARVDNVADFEIKPKIVEECNFLFFHLPCQPISVKGSIFVMQPPGGSWEGCHLFPPLSIQRGGSLPSHNQVIIMKFVENTQREESFLLLWRQGGGRHRRGHGDLWEGGIESRR